MARWYYSTNGKAEGPVTPEFLIDQLKVGRFTLVDLVFKEGEAAWKTFGEIPEFRAAYQAPPAFVPPVAPKNEIDLDGISIEREELETATTLIVLPESNSVKSFEKPEEGWPSDWRLSSSWIILRKRNDGSGYDQDGPFSAEHIIEMIGNGKIDYSQYCWKPGYTRWFRIGNLPEFDRRKRDRDNDTVNQIIPVPAIDEALPALTREELLANVENLRRDQRQKDKGPAGTDGKNLIETPLDTYAPKAARIERPSSPVPVILEASHQDDFDRSAIAPASSSKMLTNSQDPEPSWQVAAVNAGGLRQPPRGLPKAVRFGLAAFVAVAVVLALMQAAALKSRQPASQPETPKPHKPTNVRPKSSANETPPVAAPAAAAVTAAPAAPAAVVEPPQTASRLDIVPRTLETAPALEFQTDMGVQEKIIVKLKARSGDILKYGSFAKTFELARTSGGAPILDLTKEDLPAGTYFVEASVGPVQSSNQIFIGQKDDHFASELEHHIKSISLRQQSEKMALFYGAQRLEKLAKELVTESQTLKTQPLKWKRTFASWRGATREAAGPVLALAQSPSTEMAYPEQMAAFQAAIERLTTQAKEIDVALLQKRDIASTVASTIASIDEIANDFSKLREESARLSGRPQAAN